MSANERSSLYRDWTFARDALRQILRVWSLELSDKELRAVLFVHDRTIGWSKEWEVITRAQAASGVWKGEECFAAPFCSNENRAVAMLSSLCDRGFLRRRKEGQLVAYALNLAHMKIPKRLRGATSVPGGGPEVSPLGGPEPAPKEYPKERVPKRQEKRDSQAHPAGHAEARPSQMHEDLAAMKSTVVRVSALSKARHVADSSKGRFARRANSGFVPLLKAFPAVWRLMHKEHFPEFAVSPADRLSWTILHQYALNWTKVREDGEFMDYLGWVFANWSALGAGVFGWMNDFPNTPSIRILTNAKLRTYIEEAYTEKERLARWRTMDEFERMVHHLVHKRGMDKEKAEELARKRTGFVDQMKELKKERELVAAMAQRSQQAIQQEREALSRQRRAPVTKRGPLKQGEGSFGKFEP